MARIPLTALAVLWVRTQRESRACSLECRLVCTKPRYFDRAGFVRSLRDERTCYGLVGTAAFDPFVWCGRALQEAFVGLSACGLASMDPASGWSVWCSGP